MGLKEKLKIPYKTAVLVILDGFGVNIDSPHSTWVYAKRPTFEEFEKFYPFTTLQASGIAVGLPWGEEGNSEVGHLTIGSGQAIFHHLPRIISAIHNGSFFENEAFLAAVEKTKQGGSLHLMGLFSSGSVHAYVDHLYALLDFASAKGIPKVYLHLFTDGRDAPPTEAAKFLSQLQLRIQEKHPAAKIASIVGRHFAMDRDDNWDRVQKTYELLVLGRGEGFSDPVSYIENQYGKGITDEFIEPAFLTGEDGKPAGRIQNGDSVIFFNYREDSVRELAESFIAENFEKFKRERLDLFFVTMTEYEKGLPSLVAFPPLKIENPLAKVVSEADLKQLHIAETEKYAHITYFFNGGQEKSFEGEERILIASPRAVHFEEKPEMSGFEIAQRVVEALDKNYSFILVNFANGDMVGHTGDLQATAKAIEFLDSFVAKIKEKVFEKNSVLMVTADHGNAEEKFYAASGRPRTKHTINPVPFYLVAKDVKRDAPLNQETIKEKYRKVEGIITDVAPAVIELLGLKKPAEMTGVSILDKLEV